MQGFFQDANGKKSMARLLALFGVAIGGVVALGGLVGWAMDFSDAPQVILYGVLAATGGEGLKLGQKFAERGSHG